MVVGSLKLRELLPQMFHHDDVSYVNPASVDIRLGKTMQLEDQTFIDLTSFTRENPYFLQPGRFVLIATYEEITVPQDYALELKLKSSRAREGYDHSLAFWIDPGWNGVLTMEVKNVLQFTALPLWYGMPFAQCIVHEVCACDAPYQGRYQHAQHVESSKGFAAS